MCVSWFSRTYGTYTRGLDAHGVRTIIRGRGAVGDADGDADADDGRCRHSHARDDVRAARTHVGTHPNSIRSARRRIVSFAGVNHT